MSMSYDQVVSVLGEFSELKRKESTHNRATYYFPNSPIRRQTVLQELYLTGNGYLYVGYLPEFQNRMDNNRLINIKTLSQEEFRSTLKKVLHSFQTTSKG